jgi:hypothetical protein
MLRQSKLLSRNLKTCLSVTTKSNNKLLIIGLHQKRTFFSSFYYISSSSLEASISSSSFYYRINYLSSRFASTFKTKDDGAVLERKNQGIYLSISIYRTIIIIS